ncbi:hypothetical protein N8I77_006941 [Diaporthe amygdali]|uniref:Zn(2)-C6 fungal-type domain-containing protein n=1 Tax=Phomopsis amygdali TaxID=1214568 RepID=A0AAD9SJ59_PHOAM|nr:hypothetical protein N8I77_006941 [Diaporthe amygdali]
MVLKHCKDEEKRSDNDEDEDQHAKDAKWLPNLSCDEARPSCLRCTRAGWLCDGYAADKAMPNASTSRKNASAVTMNPITNSNMSISSYAIPFRVPGSQRDRQVLHYFYVRGAHEIASHFNVDFWTNTVLQQSHAEPVVRQALVSLGSLHLDYTAAAVPGNNTTKDGALAQYGRAINALRRRIERPDRETLRTALTCCILFYCFEAALGDSKGAMRHLDSGLDLLSTGRHHNAGDVDAFSRVFESLDLQATMFDDGRVPHLVLPTKKAETDTATFSSLDEAYGTFIRLQSSIFHFLTSQLQYKFCTEGSLPTSVVEEKRLLQERSDTWLSAFKQSTCGMEQDKEKSSGPQILLVQWQVSKMLIEANYPTNDNIFGASPNFRAEEILDMAKEILRHSSQDETEPKQGTIGQRCTFSSQNGIVAPLFALATKCSDENVCNRALELLSASRRREGLYDAESMAEIIHQFRTARQQKILCNDQVLDENLKGLSLESLFEQEIDGMTGGMDRLADCPKMGSTTT